MESFDFGSLPSRLAQEIQPHKPRLSSGAVNDLFVFLWAHDTYEYEHPRYRVQVALTIQLFMYLGLHPLVALSEGLYYRDITFLVTKHDGRTRLLLLMNLRGRKAMHNSLHRWKGVPMFLIDEPRERHLCPITPFLSLAISDNALQGIKGAADIDALPIPNWPEWGVLPTDPDAADISIFRRLRYRCNSRVISRTFPMKPSALEQMMRALLCRAGQLDLLESIRVDNKRFAHNRQRELKKRAWKKDAQFILLGRGQGKSIMPLLSSFLCSFSNTPWDTPLYAKSQDSRFALPLPEIIDVQLRYDHTRMMIISYLYGECCSYTEMKDMLWPFIEATQPVAFEYYYRDAKPNDDGSCLWCHKRYSRVPMKSHLLRCCRQNKIALAKCEQTEDAQKWIPSCQWAECSKDFENMTADSIAAHINKHIDTRPTQCLWSSCSQNIRDIIDLHVHLDEIHGVVSTITIPNKAHFCYECRAWDANDLDWYIHGLEHARKPSLVCGLVSFNGLLAAAGTCPYCMKDGIYDQYVEQCTYTDHIERHISREAESNSMFFCPHPLCQVVGLQIDELRNHLLTIHHIALSR